MLEEPEEGIYALFTAQNINRVLPTILSRCQIIDIKPDSKEIIVKQLKNENIPDDAANILSFLTVDINEARELYDENYIYFCFSF